MKALAVVLVAATACSFPSHLAKKTVELKLPADVQSIRCASQNGEITVVGDAAATEVALRAEIEIRAHSQAEADATLNQMSVTHDVVDGRMTIRGQHPEPLVGKVATFSYSLRVPPRIALSLASHNGSLKVSDVTGLVEVESHNGNVAVDTKGDRIGAVTHNGSVRVAARGTGEFTGTIETHNGTATLEVGEGVTAAVDATTHNGSIACGDGFAVTKKRDSSLRCQIGDGKSVVTIATHNGSVNIRRAGVSTKN